MKQISKFNFAWLAVILIIAACSNEEKKSEATEANKDTTAKATTTAEAPPPIPDAAAAAPQIYKVAKDTMGIRVLNIEFKPGDSTPIHSHPATVLYVVEGGKGEFTSKDGTKQVAELKNGMVSIDGPDVHSVKNVGTTTVKAVLIEVTRPDRAGSAQDPNMDALKVAPKLYKLVSDTLNIRVLMANYKPGASSALHAHPDNAIYLIESAKAEFSAKDGTKQEIKMDKGMSTVFPGSVHAVKNTGNSAIKVLLVEVNRPEH